MPSGTAPACAAHPVCYHTHVRVIVDSCSLISLAWSGQLGLLRHIPLSPVILDSVYREAVTEGLARGHADAAAIDHALRDTERLDDPPGGTVDERVVVAASAVGVVITNDLVVGRRSTNLGARWLRTADLVVLALRTRGLDLAACEGALAALHAAGRLTDELRDAYLEELS